MKNLFILRILGWVSVLVVPLLVIIAFAPSLVSRQESLQTDTAVSDILTVHYHSINNAITGFVDVTSALAANKTLLGLMDRYSQFRLRKLNSPLVTVPGVNLQTIDLSTERPLQGYVEILNQLYAAEGVLGIRLLATDTSTIGESPGFRWRPEKATVMFAAMKSDTATFATIYSVDGVRRLPVIIPIRNAERQLLGGLIAEFALTQVTKAVDEYRIAPGKTNSTLISKREGTYSVVAPANASLPLNSSILSAIGKDGTSTQQFSSTDGTQRTAYASISIPATPWRLVITKDMGGRAVLQSSLRNLMLAAFALTLLSLAGGWLLVLNPFNKRLTRIAHATEKMTKREFDIQLGDTTEDNIGTIARYLGQIADDVGRQSIRHSKTEQTLQNQEDHDELTGVYNKKHIEDTIERFGSNADLLPVTVISLQLRGLAEATEKLGGKATENLIVAAALRLKTTFGDNYTVARTGDNEFVLMASNTDGNKAAGLVARVNDLFTTSLEIPDGEILLGCDSGYAIAETVLTVDDALAEARILMNNSLQTHRLGKATAKIRAAMIEQAVRKKRLETWYQPIVKQEHGQKPVLAGAEAFMRIYDEQGEQIPSSMFMHSIQDFPIGQLLDYLVLKQALDTLHQWEQGGHLPPGFQLSVNLSRNTVLSTKVVKFLSRELASRELSPASIAVEISGGTEQLNADVLADLQGLGITLSMDDVGLKYSNLEQILSIEPSFVKIDQRRLQTDSNDPKDRDAQGRLNTLLQTMGMEIIAKSVETTEQTEGLQVQGIALFQGYLYDPPQNAETFIQKWGVAPTEKWREAG